MCRRIVNCFVVLISFSHYILIECQFGRAPLALTTVKAELECEFPPKMEEDLTHLRRKRLTTDGGLVCLEDYPYTVSVRYNKMEEDLTHLRCKRLTTDGGLVCLEDYPYTVSVRLHNKHWCGGAIVGTEWVLSAAQCFDYVSKEEVTVRVGSVFRDYGGRLLAAADIVRHPDYKTTLYYPEHNLALVKLNVPIVPGSRVQVVSLAPAGAELPPHFGEVVVTGYGSTSGQIREGENQELRRMIVDEVASAECRLQYGNDYRLQRDHVCLQSVVKGVALCAGDTGDPAVHFSALARGGTLYGIALFSGTEECAYKAKPGVYAKVSYSRAWIESVLSPSYKLFDQLESAASGENAIPLTSD